MSSPPGSGDIDLLSNLKRCVWRTALIAIPVALACFTASQIFPHSNLFGEGGLVESASASIWGLIVVAALYAAVRAGNCTQRLLLAWFGGLALLAGLRELDLQIMLNPKTIGEYGVRFKISWWLSGEVPLWLKVGWGVLFILVFVGLFYPVFRTRRELLSLLRTFDFRLLMFGAAFVFLALGFVVDDLLRGSQVIALSTRKILEETSELIGACLYGFAVWQVIRHPVRPVPSP